MLRNLLILAIAIILLVGVGYAIIYHQISIAEAEEETLLIKIWEDEPINPDNPPLISEWFDAKEYRKFKLLVRVTPFDGIVGDPESAPDIVIAVRDWPNYPEPGPNPGGYGSVQMVTTGWQGHGAPPFDQRWSTYYTFEGLYSNISCITFDNSGEPKNEEDYYHISLYLLISKK